MGFEGWPGGNVAVSWRHYRDGLGGLKPLAELLLQFVAAFD